MISTMSSMRDVHSRSALRALHPSELDGGDVMFGVKYLRKLDCSQYITSQFITINFISRIVCTIN